MKHSNSQKRSRFWPKEAVFVCLLTVLGLLCLCTAGAEEEDPVVVRTGDVTFTKKQVQSALQTDRTLSEVVAGAYLTDEEQAQLRQATVDRFVGAGLIQCKLAQAGRNDFTAEEEESLKAAARDAYDQTWQSLYQMLKDSGQEAEEEDVTAFMEEEGYTVNAFYEEYKASERRLRAIELFCPGMVLTEEMVQDYYETRFLAPDRERYENNIALYEEEILSRQNESFYTPAGYRAVKQILLSYPREVVRALRNDYAHVSALGQTAADAFQALALAAAEAENWEDETDARQAYHEASQALETVLQAYEQKREALTLPLVQEKVDAIRAACEAGEDFDTLIRQYSDDQSDQNTGGGYPVHPDSQNWSPAFLAAAFGLEKPGDLSEPVLTDLGIHLLYYASDIPAGDHVLTDSEKETLNASATWYYQGLELEKLIEDWKLEFEIETHPEWLDD